MDVGLGFTVALRGSTGASGGSFSLHFSRFRLWHARSIDQVVDSQVQALILEVTVVLAIVEQADATFHLYHAQDLEYILLVVRLVSDGAALHVPPRARVGRVAVEDADELRSDGPALGHGVVRVARVHVQLFDVAPDIDRHRAGSGPVQGQGGRQGIIAARVRTSRKRARTPLAK